MKKLNILLVFLILSGFCLKSNAEVSSANKSSKEVRNKAEQLFLKNVDECLTLMSEAAKKESVSGVAILAFIPGEITESWISKMKVVGKLADDKSNLLAIAYAKSSEMAVTLKNSGDSSRKIINGELGYKGGAIVKVKSGYLVAAFSGASGQQDFDISKIGLEWLAKKVK